MEPAKAADLVRKLRAKAASTTFPQEAKLLTAKADKLARKYRVDERPRRPRVTNPADFDRQAMGDYLRHQRRMTYGGVPWNTTPAENGPFSGATGDIRS